MQGQITSGTCSITQKAAIAALNADPSITRVMRDAFLERRNLVLEGLKDIPGMNANTPEGAFYVFPDVSQYFGKSFDGKRINNANDFSIYLLEEAGVAVVTGEAFGDPNCIRFSYATANEVLIEALSRIKESLKKLN